MESSFAEHLWARKAQRSNEQYSAEFRDSRCTRSVGPLSDAERAEL